MARPDLNDPEARAAYRDELRGVAKPQRLTGFILVLLGAGLWIAASYGWLGLQPDPHGLWGLPILAAGWVFMVWAFIVRNRYHRRRMAEEA